MLRYRSLLMHKIDQLGLYKILNAKPNGRFDFHYDPSKSLNQSIDLNALELYHHHHHLWQLEDFDKKIKINNIIANLFHFSIRSYY